MKKFLLLLLTLGSFFTAQADDYNYLTFETTDGDKVSVSLESLNLSISGTTLTTGTKSFPLSNLSKMYFSNADETIGIKSVTSAELDEATEIYDLQGHKILRKQVRRGAYIIKTKQGTYKIVTK